jgi:2'-5' RNA ligase
MTEMAENDAKSVAPAPPARLFLAFRPDPAMQRALVEWRRGWTWPRRAAIVPAERLHATLHFIGDVPVARLEEVARGLAVPVEPFDLDAGLGELWPRGLAVWRPERIPDPLLALHARLAEALRRLELPVESRPYRPHLTLARNAFGARPPARAPGSLWRAERYALVKSEQGYHDLATYP